MPKKRIADLKDVALPLPWSRRLRETEGSAGAAGAETSPRPKKRNKTSLGGTLNDEELLLEALRVGYE
jgi:hypothetical protein